MSAVNGRRRRVDLVLVTFALAVAVLSAATFQALQRVGDAERLIRDTEYRLCVRVNDTRAVLILHGPPPIATAKLSLYDCAPDLTGAKATVLDARERTAFLARSQVQPGP